MEILRFTLSGKSACFRKPEMNSYCYFTYGNIHKVALLGMFGAILGYGGYTQMQDFSRRKKKGGLTESYPEFYERLEGLKLSILPDKGHKKGFIPKKIQTFNNSVGYASREQGGNLIVKEQWLENPKWDICILIDSEEAEKIRDMICKRKCIYSPYLGKNDHPADIVKICVEPAVEAEFEMGRLDCLVPKEKSRIADLDYDEKEEMEAFGTFKYEEALPYGMDGWTNQYILRTFLYTDEFVEVDDLAVYNLSDDRKIVFY